MKHHLNRFYMAFYGSMIPGIFMGVGVFFLTNDGVAATLVGLGLWWVVYLILVGMVLIAKTIDDTKKQQEKVFEFMEWLKNDRQKNR